jgi:hypothetical protein
MATLYITEYAGISIGAGGYPCPEEPALAEQTLTIGVGSVQSAAFNASTQLVRLRTDAICSVKFGTDPTATAASARMADESEAFHGVNGAMKVAVITNT